MDKEGPTDKICQIINCVVAQRKAKKTVITLSLTSQTKNELIFDL